MQPGIAGQCTRQQTGLAQHLEPIADAQDWQPLRSSIDHRAHHRREPRDGPRTQVVTVGEAAGHDHGVNGLQVGIVMPQRDRLGAREPGRAGGVDVVKGAGEGDDTDASGHSDSRTISQSSMTVLASNASAIDSRSESLISPSNSNSKRLPCRTSATPA
ncbi:Uncharacterised protein [Mycobacteroides abscessus subsp. massiliense]|nr:Uncharacterised protein [Mycobacteroides abscessus subsp. massiliense]